MSRNERDNQKKTPLLYSGLPSVGGLSVLRGVLRAYFASEEACLPCAIAVNEYELTLIGEADGKKETRRIALSRIGLPVPLCDWQAASLASSLVQELTANPTLALDEHGRLVRKEE